MEANYIFERYITGYDSREISNTFEVREMKPLTKTLFAMNDLSNLGIQRVICEIVKNWNEEEYGTVYLSLHNTQGEFESYLNSNVKVYELDKLVPPLFIGHFHFVTRVIAYVRLLKQIEPDKVIAVNQGEALALCLAKRFIKNFRLIVCEHCNVSESIGDYKGIFGMYYRKCFQREYNKYADSIHTVSLESKQDLIDNWGFSPDKIQVIYNPVNIKKDDYTKEKDDNDGRFVITAASRLTQQKRIDILLSGLSILRNKIGERRFSKLHVKIYGDGELKENLMDLRDKLGLKDTVDFEGFILDPWKEVAKADLFVSTSEWEGLSVSLIEAQFVQTPILASNCPSGNKEILLFGGGGIYLSEIIPMILQKSFLIYWIILLSCRIVWNVQKIIWTDSA